MQREDIVKNIIELLEKHGLIQTENSNPLENRVSVPTYDQTAH